MAVVVAQKRIVVAARVEGPGRRETLAGSEYRVLSAVLVQSQVLHNNLGATYLPPEAFTADWAEVVNMAPVIVGDHPQKRGVHISARSPDIWDLRGAGFHFNARAGDGKLEADVYLDESRAEEVDELPEVLSKLDAGETVELSTGFPVIVEEVSGRIGNEAYDRKIYPAGFDHTAVFGGDQIGACSVDDGCGLSANEEGSGMTRRFGRVPLGFLKTLGGYLGLMPDDTATAAENQSDEDKRALLRTAVQEKYGYMGEGLYIEAVFSDEGFLVFEVWGEGRDVGLWQASFEMDAEGESVTMLGVPFRVRRVTSFEPVSEEDTLAGSSDGDGETITTPVEGGEVAAMKRQELIDQLVEKVGLKACSLAGLADEELLAIHEALPKDPTGEGSESKAVTPLAEEAKEPAEGAVPNEMATLRDTVSTLADSVKAMQESLTGLAEVTKPAVEEQARERASLVAELIGNERCPFTEEELKVRTLVELQKIQAMARGISYAGRVGSIAVPAGSQSDGFMDPVPYFATVKNEDGQKALDNGEGN